MQLRRQVISSGLSHSIHDILNIYAYKLIYYYILMIFFLYKVNVFYNFKLQLSIINDNYGSTYILEVL